MRFQHIVDLRVGEIAPKGMSQTVKSAAKYIWLTRNGSGITAAQWENAYSGWTRVRGEMLEDLAKLYPQLAFWLLTGKEDSEAGHVSVDRYLEEIETNTGIDYLMNLDNPEADRLRERRAEAICTAHGRKSDGNKER